MSFRHKPLYVTTPLRVRPFIEDEFRKRGLVPDNLQDKVNELVGIASARPEYVDETWDRCPQEVKDSLRNSLYVNGGAHTFSEKFDGHRIGQFFAWLETPNGKVFLQIFAALLMFLLVM